MAASQFTPALFAPARKLYQRTTGPIVRLGHMLVFFGRALAGIPVAFTHYRKEFVRLLSDIAWGNGSLVVGGGTAGVAIVLGIVVGVFSFLLKKLGHGRAEDQVKIPAAAEAAGPEQDAHPKA